MGNPSTKWLGELGRSVLLLDSTQLRLLADLYSENPGTGPPSVECVQRELSLSTTDAMTLVRNLGALDQTYRLTSRDVAVALAALAWSRFAHQSTADQVEVVCTGPTRLSAPVRGTFATALEIVDLAKIEVIVVGYVFTAGAHELIKRLAEARRRRGVRVTVIGNRMEEHVPVLRAAWPADVVPPAVYSWRGGTQLASLHAKLLICDSSSALVTSANFSLRGLHENIEVGLKVHSPSVERLVQFVRNLIVADEVEKIEWN